MDTPSIGADRPGRELVAEILLGIVSAAGRDLRRAVPAATEDIDDVLGAVSVVLLAARSTVPDGP